MTIKKAAKRKQPNTQGKRLGSAKDMDLTYDADKGTVTITGVDESNVHEVSANFQEWLKKRFAV